MTLAESILLVDDTRTDALLYSALLRRASNTPPQIDHAQSLAAALRMLEENSYAAILLDLGLPDSEDIQGVRRIAERHPQVPIVVLTGRDDDDIGERAIAAGAQDYLHKADARPAEIARALRHAQARQQLENHARETHEALLESRSRLATLADALPLLLMFLDRDLRVEFINSGWPRELRRPASLILGQPVVELLREPAATHFAQGLEVARAGVEHDVDFEDPGDADVRTWNAVFIPQRGQAGRVDGIHVMLRDVTLERAHRQELVRRAEQDPLTGSLNRAGLQVHGSHAWHEAARHGRSMGVFFFDLDGFKNINDTLGHTAGDGLLQEIAARVRNSVRADDIVARMGGDEFVVIAKHVADAGAAKRLAEKLLAVVNATPPQAVSRMEPAQHASCSLGYCIADATRLTLAQALECADEALYAAKRAGKGRAVQWQPGHTPVAPATP